MTAHLFPTLPTDWHERNIDFQPGTGCWLWRNTGDHPALSWRAARTLIATEMRIRRRAIAQAARERGTSLRQARIDLLTAYHHHHQEADRE